MMMMMMMMMMIIIIIIINSSERLVSIKFLKYIEIVGLNKIILRMGQKLYYYKGAM